MGCAVWRGVRSVVVFCEDAGAVVCGQDEDGVDGEEGHVGRHRGGQSVPQQMSRRKDLRDRYSGEAWLM